MGLFIISLEFWIGWWLKYFLNWPSQFAIKIIFHFFYLNIYWTVNLLNNPFNSLPSLEMTENFTPFSCGYEPILTLFSCSLNVVFVLFQYCINVISELFLNGLTVILTWFWYCFYTISTLFWSYFYVIFIWTLFLSVLTLFLYSFSIIFTRF